MPDSLLPLGRFFKPTLKLLCIRKARGPALIDAAHAVHGKFGSLSHTQLRTKMLRRTATTLTCVSLRQGMRDATPMEAVMGSFKTAFDPLDLEIMDRVYEVAWAHVQAREPSRNTASDGARQRRYAERSSASHVSQAPDTSTSTRSLRWCLRRYLSSPSALKLAPKLTGRLALSVERINRHVIAAVEREQPGGEPQASCKALCASHHAIEPYRAVLMCLNAATASGVIVRSCLRLSAVRFVAKAFCSVRKRAGTPRRIGVLPERYVARAITTPYTRRFAFNILGRVTGAVEIVKPVGAEHHVSFPRLGLGEGMMLAVELAAVGWHQRIPQGALGRPTRPMGSTSRASLARVRTTKARLASSCLSAG